MALLEKQLVVKRSTIPGSGKGLFTKQFIAKETRIIEYKGKITTWKIIKKSPVFNAYVFYMNSNRVIDAMNYKKAFARFANDAKGITKIKGLKNNCRYEVDGNKVFIVSVVDINAGSEILVSYGKEYWDVIRYNQKLES
ncbi:MAG: SET domain-containing protein-lysine N-methyltransferase [Parafilimonas sp.]